MSIVKFAPPQELLADPTIIERICVPIACGADLQSVRKQDQDLPNRKKLAAWLAAGRSGELPPADPRVVLWNCYVAAKELRNEFLIAEARAIADDDSKDLIDSGKLGDDGKPLMKPNMAAVSRAKLRVTTLLDIVRMTGDDYDPNRSKGDKLPKQSGSTEPRTLEDLRERVKELSQAVRQKGLIDPGDFVDITPEPEKPKAGKRRIVQRKKEKDE